MSLSCDRIPVFVLWLPIFMLQICYLTLPVLLPLPTRSLMELLILCCPRNLYVSFVFCCPELGCHSLPSSEAIPFGEEVHPGPSTTVFLGNWSRLWVTGKVMPTRPIWSSLLVPRWPLLRGSFITFPPAKLFLDSLCFLCCLLFFVFDLFLLFLFCLLFLCFCFLLLCWPIGGWEVIC